MIITIARQAGCSAADVGAILASHYGVKLYTRHDLLLKAKEMGLYDELYDFFSEQPIDYLAMAATMQEDAVNDVRKRLREALLKTLAGEDCIIVGRCANIMLASRGDLTTVFLHAPKSERIAHAQAQYNLDYEQAVDYVDRLDDERSSYHYYYTGHTWGNAADYDIALDVHRFSIERTAQLIIDAIHD